MKVLYIVLLIIGIAAVITLQSLRWSRGRSQLSARRAPSVGVYIVASVLLIALVFVAITNTK